MTELNTDSYSTERASKGKCAICFKSVATLEYCVFIGFLA